MPNDLEQFYLNELKVKSLASIDFFTERILGYKNQPFHKEWYSYLEDEESHQIVILAPRSHAKTTCLSINYSLREIVKNSDIRIILASNTVSQAQSFLREVVAHIEGNKLFRSVFGNIKPAVPEKWTDGEVIVSRSLMSKDATISCVGTGGTVLTKRADLIVCDDILDAENTATPEQRKKVKDWFWRVLMPCLEPNGKLVVVGTRWAVADLYGELLKDPSFQVRKVYKAVNKGFLGSKALWPERWSLEKLEEKKKSAGSLIFNQQYQNEPIDDESALFKQAWIQIHKGEIDLSGLDVFGALDPAISKKETADYSVFTTIGVDKKGKIYVLDVARGRWSVSEQIDVIFNKYAFFKHQRIGIESVAFQSVIKDELDRISQEKRIYLPTVDLKPDKDKYRRASALTPFFENGVIFLKENQTDLIDELLSFPNGRHDDCVDSLGYAVQLVREVPPEPRLTILGGDDEDRPEERRIATKFGHSRKYYEDRDEELPSLLPRFL